MNINEINPFIRYGVITRNFQPYSGFGYANDCRMFYILTGKCILEIEDSIYCLTPRSLALIPPGVKYRFSEFYGLEIGILNFDFDQSRSRVRYAYKLRGTPQGSAVHFKDFSGFEAPIVIENYISAEKYIREMSEEYSKRRLFYRERTSGLMKILICDMVRYISTNRNTSGEMIESILTYIASNLDGDLSGEALGAKFGYHPYYFSRLIRLHTGKPLKQYVISARINEAKNLLQTTDLSLSEIASRTGFENAAYFSNSFKAKTKMSPGEYRKGCKEFI